jgi:hypothetical protein
MIDECWTAVVGALGVDAGGGRWLSRTHPWELRTVPVPLRSPGGDVVGGVFSLTVQDGLLRAAGRVYDPEAAVAMFGDGDRSPSLFPALDLTAHVVAPVHDPVSDTMVAELRDGTVTAIALTSTPAWPDLVRFERSTGGTDG